MILILQLLQLLQPCDIQKELDKERERKKRQKRGLSIENEISSFSNSKLEL